VEPNQPDDTGPKTEIEKRTLLLIEHLSHTEGESDRGRVLFLAAQLDVYLREVLESFLVDDKSVSDLFEGPYAPFGSLSAKTKAAFVLGLITRREAEHVDSVRRVRNVFAHQLDASFESAEVKKLCGKQPIFDDRLCDRDAFFHLGLNAALPLLYRSIRVKREWRRNELIDPDASEGR